MSAIKIWQKVPDGSQLVLSIASEGNIVAGARLVDDKGSEEQWPHEQLVPGPKRKRLRSPRRYSIRIRIAFSGAQTTATIKAKIVKPDGQTHGNPYNHTVQGVNGTIRRATILISTLQS